MRRNNQTKENLEALARYEYAALAANLIKTEPSLANQSLMLLNEKLDDDKGTRDLMQEFVYSNERGIKKALEVYAGEYEKALGSLTIGELSSNYYENTLEGLAEEDDLVTVKEELGKFADETLSDIKNKLKKTGYILKGVREEVYDFDEKEIEEAKNTHEKYANMFNVLGLLNESKLESLRPSVAERSYKNIFETMSEKIRDSN